MPKKLTSQKDAELNGAIQEMLDSGIGESDINSFVADFINQYGVDEAALSEKKNEVATPTSGQGVSGVGTSNTSSTRMAVGASPSEKASSLGGYSVSEMLSGKALGGGVPQTKEVVEVDPLRGDPIMYNIDVHEAKRGKAILSGKSQKPVEERFTEKIVAPKATKQDKKNAANKLASTMFPSLPESELSKIAVGLEDNVDGNYALSVKNKQADDDYVAVAPLTDVLATMQQRRDDIGKYGSKDKMIAFEQSKQGKVLEYANMIVRGEPLSAEDNAYLRQAAPQTYSDLLKLEKSPNGETITDVNVIAEIRKPKVDSILNEQGALRTQQDIAAFQGVVPNLGDIGSGMKDYIETIGSQEQAALKKIEDKYPIQFVSRKNGEAMERVPQDRPQEYYDEINKTKQPFAEMRYKGANADASLYALKNKDRGVDALVVGEKFFKNLDPTSYKTYLNGGSESRDYKILAIQKGIEVMANSGDPALIEQSKIQRAKFEAEYPDYNKVDVLKKLAFEKIKRQGGANWIYNDDFITIEEGDELAKQLSAKDKKTWNWIKQNEIAQRYTNNPQLIPIPFPSAGGLVNELATGFMMPIKGTFNTVVGATESSQEKANRALQNDYLSQKLFDREQGEKRVAELRAKKGKTVDDIKEIIAEEERLGLKSSKQITGDGMAGLTGQVVGQATLGRLATPVVSGLGRGLSALPQLERVAKLGAYMSDIKNATNLANSGIAYLSSYDDARLEAERIMPNGNIVEKSIYASGVAALNAATERIFKDEKIFDALRREVAPELAVLARELSRGNITESALRGSLKSLITDIGKKYIPSIAIENQKEALEEVATSVGTSVLKGLGRLTGAVSEKDFVVDDELDAMYNTWLETTISGIPTGIMAGVGDVRQNRIGKNSLYQLSIDPTKQNELKDVIRAQVVQGKMSDDESMEKIQIINALSDIGKNTIPLINKIKPLTTPEKAQLTNLLLAERKLKKDIKNPRFEDVKGVLEKQLSEVVSKKDKIINGEVIIDNDLVPMTPKEWEEKQKKQAEQDAELKAAIDEKLSPTQTFGVVDNADGTFTVVNEKGAKEIFKTKDEADARVVELSSEIIAPDEGAKIESAVIEIGGKTYEGKNHAEAILSAKADGQDISKVDRQAQGKFKLSDGTIIDRAEAKTRFGQDRSEMIIPQDEAANKANEEYAKIAPRQGTPEKISQPIELSIDTEEAAPTTAEPQQDIEAKKADIEKRREGENNRFPSGQTTFKKINPDGENTEVTDRQKATIERVIDGNIKEGKTPAQIVETLNHAGYVVLFGNETTTLLNYLEDRINGAISIPFFEFNSKLRDKINAKYDAELKALEATPAAPQQDNTALSIGGGIKNNAKDSDFILPINEIDGLRKQKQTDLATGNAIELDSKISKEGLRESVVITYYPNEGVAELTDGHTRLDVLKDNGAKNIPIRVVEKYTDAPESAKAWNPPIKPLLSKEQPESAAQPKAEEVKPTTKAAEKVETKTNTKAFFGTKKTAQEVSKQNKKEENEKQQSKGNENNYVSPSGEVLNTPTNEEGFADAEREVADAEKATGIRVGELPINDIAVRPDIFQFKAMDEKSGINKSEKIEGKFDKNLAATIAVWEDKKGELGEVGKVYVVDGHHRMEFAKRSGQSDMNVFYIDAETAKDARVIGAKANISQGRGTSIDAAKVYREASKEQLEGFEPSSQVAKEGNALSKLNDDVFDKVAQGVVSKKVGIALSQVDENMQSEVLPLVNKFANNPIATQDKLARYAKKLQQRVKDGNIEVKKIATLFGEETELDVQNDATVESELINAIKSDARLFNAVKNNKDVLEEANNQIDTEKASEETQRAKIAAGLFDTYITRKSVNEVYTKAANAYKTAKTKVEKQRIITNAANDIKNAIQKELDSDINGTPKLKTASQKQESPQNQKFNENPIFKQKAKDVINGISNDERVSWVDTDEPITPSKTVFVEIPRESKAEGIYHYIESVLRANSINSEEIWDKTLQEIISDPRIPKSVKQTFSALALVQEISRQEGDGLQRIGKAIEEQGGGYKIYVTSAPKEDMVAETSKYSITINMNDFFNSLSNVEDLGDYIKTIAQEEYIHLLTNRLVKTKDYEAVYDEMSDEERKDVSDTYGISADNRLQIGGEYTRMYIQDKVFGITTEGVLRKSNPAVIKILNKLLDFLRDMVATQPNKTISKIAQKVESAIDEANRTPQLSATKPPTTITKKAFDKLITLLKKAFPNTKVFTDEKTVVAKLKEYGYDVAKFLSAWHGSPHSFDKFSMDKIGTGEGAQAFGYGLYFTDLKGIAENYARKLASNKLKEVYRQGDDMPIDAYDSLKKVDFFGYGDEWQAVGVFLKGKSKESFMKDYDITSEEYDAIDKSIAGNNRNLYKVSLHKGKTPEQYNWLEWDKPLSREQIISLAKALKGEIVYPNGKTIIRVNLGGGDFKLIETRKGAETHNQLSRLFGGDKATSEFLLNNGIDGVKYRAESIARGANSDNARGFNYVVFDENAIEIEEKIQFLKTPNGVIYGAKFPDGSVYLNEGAMSASAPIHEFSHIWESLMPEEWAKGLEIFKNSTGFKRALAAIEANKSYSNLTTEQKASEALNTLIGVKGEGYYRGGAMLSKFQNWLKGFIKALAAKLKLRNITPDDKLEQFVGKVLGDLMGGKEIVQENNTQKVGKQVRFMTLPDGRKVPVRDMGIDVVNGFYSPIEKRLAETKIEKQSANKWLTVVGKGDEAIWTGVKDWLEAMPPTQQVYKSEIQQWMKDNRIQVVEVVKDDRKGLSRAETIEYNKIDKEIDGLEKERTALARKYYDENKTPERQQNYQDVTAKIKTLMVERKRLSDKAQDQSKNTKFSQYQLEGEKSKYKEVLVTMPNNSKYQNELNRLSKKYNAEANYKSLRESKATDSELEILRNLNTKGEKFKSSHFDEPNILVHLRMNTRVDAEGKKVLFLEEVQSDWGQKGKKEGFEIKEEDRWNFEPIKRNGETVAWKIELKSDKNIGGIGNTKEDAIKDANKRYGTEINTLEKQQKGTPSAPFVTDTNAWTKLGLKYALKEAVKQGATKIAWTTGEQQNDRYDLSKQVDDVYTSSYGEEWANGKYEKRKDVEIAVKGGGVKKFVVDENGKVLSGDFIGERLDNIIGKEMAEKILSAKEDTNFGSQDLKVGGKGMKGFYGSPTEGSLGIVGNVAKSLFKQEPKTVNIEGKKDLKNEERIKYLQHFVDELPQLEKSVSENKLSFTEQELDNAIEKGSITNESYKQGIKQLKKYEESVAKYNEYKERADEYNKLKFGTTQHSIDITPELKAQVEEGLPLFMAATDESISARIGELSKLMDSIDAATTTSELKGAKAAYEKELSKDEKLKYIVTNFANITNQLQAKGVLTKIGKCP